MNFLNVFRKKLVLKLGEIEVWPVLGEVEVMLVPGEVLGRGVLNSPLPACLLIDNYWVLAKGDKEDIIIYQA